MAATAKSIDNDRMASPDGLRRHCDCLCHHDTARLEMPRPARRRGRFDRFLILTVLGKGISFHLLALIGISGVLNTAITIMWPSSSPLLSYIILSGMLFVYAAVIHYAESMINPVVREPLLYML